MAVSVRMEPLLEQELERAARQLGVSKSQFIIDAVERALGRRDPFEVLQEVERRYGLQSDAATPPPLVVRESHVPSEAALQARLQARHESDMRDWLAYQEARRRGQPWTPDDVGSASGSGPAP